MSPKLLLPHRCKRIGWFLLIPATIMGIILSISDFEAFALNLQVPAIFNTEYFGSTRVFTWVTANVTNTITGAVFIAGAMLTAFSKEKTEDEFIGKTRLSSLLWAVYVNYVLLLLAFLFVYGASFLNVMIYNMFTVLIIFIARFNYILYKNTITLPGEK